MGRRFRQKRAAEEEIRQLNISLERRVEERTRALVAAKTELQGVLDAATQVSIIATDEHGLIAVFNRGAGRMFGYTSDEMVGQQTPSVFHVESEVIARGKEMSEKLGRPMHGFDIFVEGARNGNPEEREWTLVRRDGTRFSASLNITASRDSEGKLTGFLGIVSDVTARRKADKGLHDQALMLDLAHDTIFIRDREDRITYWNQGAQGLYGWAKEEALGQVTHNLFKTRFPQPLVEIKAIVLVDGHWEGELIHTRRDGSVVTVASRWTLQRDDSGQPTSIIEMNYDVTERKAAEQELEKSRVRLDTIVNGSLDGVIVFEAVRGETGLLQDLRYTMFTPKLPLAKTTKSNLTLRRNAPSLPIMPRAISWPT